MTTIEDVRARAPDLVAADAQIAAAITTATALADDFVQGGTVPESVMDEATLRLGTYLLSVQPNDVRAVSDGEVSATFDRRGTAQPITASGAASLLQPFRARRGGLV